MDEDFEMDENAEETLARLVAELPPESYERLGPGLQEQGIALAERREALREVDCARELQERVLEDYDQANEDLERAKERTQNALRLIKDAL
jgi:hypothetical protein